MPQNLGDMEWLTKLQDLVKLGDELAELVVRLCDEDEIDLNDFADALDRKAQEFLARQEKP